MVTNTNELNLLAIGRGLGGITYLVDQLKKLHEENNLAEGTVVNVYSLDKKPLEELGGPAYSAGVFINSYTREVKVNTLPDKTDASADQLFKKEFLTNLFETEAGLEIRQIYDGVDWEDVKESLDKNENIYLPRVLISEFGKFLWDKAEGYAAASDGKIKLHTLTGTAKEISEHSIDENGLETFNVKYIDEDGAELSLNANIIADFGRRAVRLPILDKDKKEINDSRIVQDPFEDFGINEDVFYNARAENKPLNFVIKGFGNSGMDFASVISTLAEKYGVEYSITAIQRHNEGIVVHPSEKIDPDYEKSLKKLFLEAKNVDELWAIYKEEHSNTKYKKGEIIFSGKADDSVIGNTLIRPQHVADTLRSVLNEVFENFSQEDIQKWNKEYQRIYSKDRNRAVPELATKITKLLDSGRLTLVTGEIEEVSVGEKVNVNLQLKKGGNIELKADYLFNAVSPFTSLNDEFSQSVLKHGIAKEAIYGGFSTKAGSVDLVDSGSKSFFIGSNTLGKPENTGLRDLIGVVAKTVDKVSNLIKNFLGKKENQEVELETKKQGLDYIAVAKNQIIFNDKAKSYTGEIGARR